ncbi:MAG: glycosyltransferase [bacterium]|nr:glycosyltransferase [bacterium]
MRTAVIIIPTYNEAQNIQKLIEGIFEIKNQIPKWELKVLIVDSNSPDNTSSIIKNLQKQNKNVYLVQTKKEGLGKAYVTGFKYSLKNLDPYVLFEMDADLSHDPANIPNFLNEIENGADFVIGTRYSKGGSIPKDWAYHRKLFSVLGNIVIRLGFARLNISDWTSGYRSIKSWVVKQSVNKVDKFSGYVFQVATLDEAIKNNAKIVEIPINFTDRIEGVSKINSLQYIVQTLIYVFTHSSFIKYVIVGATSAAIDFGLSFIFIELWKLKIWLATLLSVESSIIYNFLMNNFWSFSYKKIDSKIKHANIKGFLKFNFLQSFLLLIQVIGITTLANLYGKEWWYVYKTLLIAIIIPLSYFLYNKFIWKNKKA